MDPQTPPRRLTCEATPVGATGPLDAVGWEDLHDGDPASQDADSDLEVDEDERFWTPHKAKAVETPVEDDVTHAVDESTKPTTSDIPPDVPKPKPLRLLDLPVDILELIMKEITHTNDMCSLTLVCSTLHHLATPVIYSRFDIVWPDNTIDVQPRAGVDALTYGLATLVMGNEIFNENAATNLARRDACSHCGHVEVTQGCSGRPPKRRRGNNYAQHVRKFSLGNGPPEWVRDYTVGKEAGKMLGTLVALAVGRMRNLEIFNWDMPTGVLRDVWVALASLGDRNDGSHCRLERVHIRWHNSWESPDAPSSPTIQAHNSISAQQQGGAVQASAANIAQATTQSQHHNAVADSDDDGVDDDDDESLAEVVEHPTFSILPPLKALSVLDIDELNYLDEMKVLIGRSKHKMRELRIGIANHVVKKDWVSSWEGEGARPVSATTTSAQTGENSQRRIGGVLGILFSQLGEHEKAPTASPLPTTASPTTIDEAHDVSEKDSAQALGSDPPLTDALQQSPPQDTGELATSTKQPSGAQLNAGEPTRASIKGVFKELFNALDVPKPTQVEKHTPAPVKLSLEILELERVPLSPRIMTKYLDWSRLTQLTLLNCPNTDALWRTLAGGKIGAKKRAANGQGSRPTTTTERQAFGLRRLYADDVTPIFLSFLKDVLEPNSLETLVLQNRYKSNVRVAVTVEDIYKSALRRHRGSLRKVSIDSSDKLLEGGIATSGLCWEYWVVSKDILAFMLSAKMPKLKELCVSINQVDWVSTLKLRQSRIKAMLTHMAALSSATAS